MIVKSFKDMFCPCKGYDSLILYPVINVNIIFYYYYTYVCVFNQVAYIWGLNNLLNGPHIENTFLKHNILPT